MTTKMKEFDATAITAFEPTEKIGLAATINSEGLPHITLITSMVAADSGTLAVGQFCKGVGKDNMRLNNNVAFLVMTLARRMWRGKARWTHALTSGAEYDRLNNQPMFRYNTYFGINTVHYLDLVEVSGGENLDMGSIVRSAITTMLFKNFARKKQSPHILNQFGETLFNTLDALKFISYIDSDGFPVLIPVIQCQAADSARLTFSLGAYGDELAAIPEGATVAVFAMNMKIEDVLVRGIYRGLKRAGLAKLGVIDINWVYNSMPPCHGQIYPETKIKAVTEF